MNFGGSLDKMIPNTKTVGVVRITEPFSNEPHKAIKTDTLSVGSALKDMSGGAFPFWAYIDLMQLGVNERDIVNSYMTVFARLARDKFIGVDRLVTARTLQDETNRLAELAYDTCLARYKSIPAYCQYVLAETLRRVN